MKTWVLSAMSILFSAGAMAQLQEGKIYFRASNAIDVYFHLKVSEGTPQQFYYSTDPAGTVKMVTASEVEKIEFKNGATYESYHINVPVINKDYINRSKAEYDFKSNWFGGAAFMERIFGGEVSLYQFVDDFGFSHFFYKQRGDSTATLLRNNSFLNERGDMENDEAWKNMVSFLANRYCGAPVNTDQLAYTANSLGKTFTRINRCAGVEVSMSNYNKGKRLVANFGLTGGVVSLGLGAETFRRSVSPVVGIWLELAPARSPKKYKFNIDATFQYFNQVEDSVNNALIHSQARVKFSLIHMNTSILLYTNTQQRGLFGEAGLSSNYLFNHTRIVTEKNVLYNSIYTGTAKQSNLFFFGATAGAGYDFKIFSLEARYGLMLHPYSAWLKNYYGLVAKLRVTHKKE